MKRLVKNAQFHGVTNSPMLDGIPSEELDRERFQRLRKDIENNEYDPVKEADDSSDSYEFNFPPYKVKAIRNTLQDMDDSGNTFSDASRYFKNDQWILCLLDQNNQKIATKPVSLSKQSDVSAILELTAMKFAKEYQL